MEAAVVWPALYFFECLPLRILMKVNLTGRPVTGTWGRLSPLIMGELVLDNISYYGNRRISGRKLEMFGIGVTFINWK